MPRLVSYRYDEWAAWVREQHRLDRPQYVAVDTETTGVGFYDVPFAATVTWRRPDGSLLSGYFDLDEETPTFHKRWMSLVELLEETPFWVGHNMKFDLQKLQLGGIINPRDYDWGRIHDTQMLAHLLDENRRKGLKFLAVELLGVDDTVEVTVQSGPNKGKKKRVAKDEHRLAQARRKLGLKKEDGYHLLPRDVLIPYALRDTEYTLMLFEKLWPVVREEEPLLEAYALERAVTITLLRMESEGFQLDLDYLKKTTSRYGVLLMETWQEVADLAGRSDINPNAPAQLLEALKARGVRVDSTDAATLAGVDDPLAAAILRYRETQKIHKTYLKGLEAEHRNGVVHPNFNQLGARTGRMSSGSAKE